MSITQDQVNSLAKEINALNEKMEKAGEFASKSDVKKLADRYEDLSKMREESDKGFGPFLNKEQAGEFTEWLIAEPLNQLALRKNSPLLRDNRLLREDLYNSNPMRYVERTLQDSTTNSAGGFTVPTVFSDILHKQTTVYGSGRKYNTVVSDIQGGTWDQVIEQDDDDYGTFLVTQGTDAAQETDITFSRIQLTPTALALITRMSGQLVSQSRFEVATLVADQLARKLAKTEDRLVYRGTGAANTAYNSITGYESNNSVNTLTITTDADLYTTNASGSPDDAAPKGFDILAKMLSLVSEYTFADPAADIAWYMNRTVYSKLCALKDTNGNLILQRDPTAAPYGSILGFPVRIVPILATGGASGNDAMQILFGDTLRAGVIGLGRNMRIEYDPYYAFQQDISALRIIEEFDFDIRDPNAVAILLS